MSDASAAHLASRLAIVRERVRAAVRHHRQADPEADDRFRGLYISEAEVDFLLDRDSDHSVAVPPDDATAGRLAAAEAAADDAERHGDTVRLRALARSFALDGFDLELLLVALGPDLDPRLERLYAYLHDDVSRRRASVGLALELCGVPAGSGHRRRLGPGSPLVAGGLVLVEEPDRPFLTRPLRVPDRVAASLLGDDAPDQSVATLLTSCSRIEVPETAIVSRALVGGIRLVYVRDQPGGAALSLAAAGIERAGGEPLAVDLTRVGPETGPGGVARDAAREAALRGATLVAGPIDALADRPGAIRAFADGRHPVVLYGARTWDPQWSAEEPCVVAAPALTVEERATLWRDALGPGAQPVAVEIAGHPFRLSPEQVIAAARVATARAALDGRAVDAADLCEGARSQNAAGLERLARRISPRVGWDDLVLPRPVVGQLGELVARVRQRDRVLGEWGMGRNSSKGSGVKALFAGDSGTGKTISAEVVARALGLDLYVIDLSTVVDKYVGETEKNLDRIFAEADRVNGVLLFDEADALFGKRSEVKDAQDRYANVEVAYLLQRMELFQGLAILTTNLRANLDEAFARRLDVIVDFPMPEEDDRRRLWDLNLPAGERRDDDIDLDFLAQAFKISGGNIRNIVLTAAFLAAEEDRPIAMRDLIRGTEREYRKLGHLCVESEFGRYFHYVVELGTR